MIIRYDLYDCTIHMIHSLILMMVFRCSQVCSVTIDRYPLPAGYAIYFQKAYSTYALFHQGRRVSGTTVRIGTGGHEGAHVGHQISTGVVAVAIS